MFLNRSAHKAKWLAAACGAAALWLAALPAHALEQVVLRNGFTLLCNHEQPEGRQVRLYLDAGGQNYLEVRASDIVSRTPAPATASTPELHTAAQATAAKPRSLRQIVAAAGRAHDIDTDLLASVIEQESGGHAHAVSRAGARGLMQLMPATAARLGVRNSFAPAQNVQGGTAYLDQLLRRYHNNLPLALAAYNAGPAAVDRWHGIPPYAETRQYVARVIHDYNRRYEARLRAARKASRTAPLPDSGEVQVASAAGIR
uniref:Lytic transglycosylase domain-containing protein n=1 Tax=Acidobacterium capsulatum TaxID=33075 RepID=A0A7V4XS98_9BACT